MSEFGGEGDYMGGFGDYGDESYDESDYGDSGLLGNLESRTKVSSTSVHDVPVEFYGIIYIYNPVDKERLGIEDMPSSDDRVQPTSATATD
jgi:hypothetical protein